MHEFQDAIEIFINIIDGFRYEQINHKSSLDEMVLKTSKENFAYVDNRKDAIEKYNIDFWDKIKTQQDFADQVKSRRLSDRILYSKSDQFPDFLFKTDIYKGDLNRGSLLELKDSNSGSIASFNSTIPTKNKSLNEINIINGNDLVSRIASIFDGKFASNENYYNFQRKCLYLIRTNRNNYNKVKISIVDGSFFETIPKDHLIYQMFLNILREHIQRKNIDIPEHILCQIEKSLSFVSDQTIIAASQNVEKASIKPRFRIMAEVHAEGNPHSSYYPEILERTLNLILQESNFEEEIERIIINKISKIRKFDIQHKRNGRHIVFQYRI